MLLSRCKLNNLLDYIPRHRSFSGIGGTGDIRGAGGTFGKKEKAQEEQYFRQKEKEELTQFKKELDEKSLKKTAETKKSDNKPSKK